jgi:GGDEF domain-containing protein
VHEAYSLEERPIWRQPAQAQALKEPLGSARNVETPERSESMAPEHTDSDNRTAEPETRAELQRWVRENIHVPPLVQASLLSAIEGVFVRHERLWQESKHEAIQALSSGFAEKMARVKKELSAKDATVSTVARYFEALVADLTDKSNRDPKTKLMNFCRFTEQLESFLALEQRGRWCAIGLVDIAGFKWYNDTLGHAQGDRIIERVAALLSEQVRSDDIIAQERPGLRPKDLHARFGGDEFCFLIPDVADCAQARAIGDRFRRAVEQYDWARDDSQLSDHPVRVDVGVVCLRLGAVAGRRSIAGPLAAELIQRADHLMYAAKGQRADHVYLVRAEVRDERLLDLPDRDTDVRAL